MQNLPKAIRRVRSYFEWADTLGIISLFAIGALVYGVFISSLGFYWDDWPVVWVYNSLGAPGLAKYFAGERPGAGWMYVVLAPILGISPIGWHVVALGVRCISSGVLFVAFCRVWPGRKDIAWLLGALALLYPGFTQQPIALTYLYHHLSFFFFVVSLTTTIFSLTVPTYRWLFLVTSLLTGACSYLITEYFIGLELFRLFVIEVLASREGLTQGFKKLGTVLIAWSPYATVWIGYVVWRTFIFRTASDYGTASFKDADSDISRILSSPIHEALARVFGGIHNILMATVLAWARPFNPDLADFTSRSAILSLTIAAMVVVIAIYTLRRVRTNSLPLVASEPSDENPPRFPASVFLLGLLGLAFAGLPVAFAGLSAEFTAHPSFLDRVTLPFMLASSLTLSGLLAALDIPRLSRVLLPSVILFAFSAYQVQNENLYRRDWLTQKSLFWQIAWRAPILKRGTSIFVDGLPGSLCRNHTAGVLNLLYNQDDSAGRLDYFIFDLSQLTVDRLSWARAKLSYRPGEPVVGRVRSFQFQGTTTQSIVSWLSPSGTFRIITQPYASEILRGSALCVNLSPLSKPEAVVSETTKIPDGPLLKIFGPEPKSQWLYFYEKAELERQLRHWDAVAMLGDEVMRQGYKPTDPSEWFPFIDGYTRTHRYRTAADISNIVLDASPDALAPLSSLWLRVKREDMQNSAELGNALGVLGDKLVLRDWQ